MQLCCKDIVYKIFGNSIFAPYYCYMKEEKIVQMLSNGYTVKEIAIATGMNIRTLEAKLVRVKDQNGAKNIHHLVANFLRKKKIK